MIRPPKGTTWSDVGAVLAGLTIILALAML